MFKTIEDVKKNVSFISVNEAARRMSIHPKSVEENIKFGSLFAIKGENGYLIPEFQIDGKRIKRGFKGINILIDRNFGNDSLKAINFLLTPIVNYHREKETPVEILSREHDAKEMGLIETELNVYK